MDAVQVSRRADLQGKTIRRLLRRGSRGRISKLLARIRPEDVAVMFGSFTPSEQASVFEILRLDFSEAAIDVLMNLEPQARLGILQALSADQIAQLLELAASDDAVALLDALPEELAEQVMAIVDLEDRFSDVQAQLVYDDDTAGRIMDTEFMALPEHLTVAEATSQLRQFAKDVDMISYLYVIDGNDRLAGVTPLRNLLLANPEQTLGELMNASVIHVDTDTDQEEVAQMAARYDLLAIPVVDDDHRLVGIVTIDDIVDIFKEEANEDFFKMAGTSDDELVYQDRSFKVAGIRLPWILFNLIGLLGAGLVVSRFEKTFGGNLNLALLVGFIPVIMGMAGNVGSQTSTISVRGLATGRLALGSGQIGKFVWQQLKVGVLLASTCSVLVAIVAFILGKGERPIDLAIAVGASLFITVLLASCNGALVPVLFERLGFDPAVASGPLVTTANDVLGIIIYFGLSSVLFQVLAA